MLLSLSYLLDELQIAALENARKNTIGRIVWVQKQYRGLRALRRFQELKQAAIILQSCKAYAS